MNRAGRGPLVLPVIFIAIAFALTGGGLVYWLTRGNHRAHAQSSAWYSGTGAFQSGREDQARSHAAMLILICPDGDAACGELDKGFADPGAHAALKSLIKVRLTPEEWSNEKALVRLDPHAYPSLWLLAAKAAPFRPIPVPSPPTGQAIVTVVTATIDQAVKDLVRTGSEQQQAGRNEEALQTLTEALALEPNQPEAFLWQGLTRAQIGEKELGVRDLKHALELKPDYLEAYDQLGFLLIDMGRYDEAIESLSHLIDKSPAYESGRALQLRATARYKKGDLQNALADAKQACALGNADACKSAEGAAKTATTGTP